MFSDLIGGNGSLHYAIEQCKAAMNYPGSGLAVLLHGPAAVRALLAAKLYDYCVQRGLIGSEGKLITVNCAEYSRQSGFLSDQFVRLYQRRVHRSGEGQRGTSGTGGQGDVIPG